MDLCTQYLGLKLKNPLVPAASPLTRDLDSLKRLEDSGAAAVTLFSLFEEQIEHETELIASYLDYGSDRYAEASSYFPTPDRFHSGPDQYLDLVRKAKETLDIPVIASLNGVTTGGWIDYAKQMADAGADALELNVNWIETDPNVTGQEVEQRYVDVVTAVASTVALPVTVKIGAQFSSVANIALRLGGAGARGLVLFNRFYQPDFEVEKREVKPHLVWSTSHDMRLPLHWIAILYDKVPLDLALSTGVHSPIDVVKAVMAGARAVTCASILLDRGIEYLGRLVYGLEEWMTNHDYESLDQLRGCMSHQRVANASAFERANYMKELLSFRPEPLAFR